MITPFGDLPNRLAVDMSLAEQHEWLARRVTRRSVIGAGFGLAGVMLWSSPARAEGGGVFGAQLAYGANPQRSMIVAFGVDGPFARATVRATNGAGHGADAEAAVQMVRGSERRYGRATLDGLQPDSRYDYVITLDGRDAMHGSLQTAPSSADAFRFTAFGDQGVDANATAMVGRLGQLAPRLHLFLGDLAYADLTGRGGPGDAFQPARWDTWIHENTPIAGATPWMCAIGNHEMEPGFDLHGYAGVLARVPIGGASPIEVPVATTYTVGNVGFVGLDSNDVSYELPANRGWSGDAQTRWLSRTLATLRQPGSPVDFIVAYMHHPPYGTNRSHDCEGGIRESWVPLFDRYSVDLVLSGHSHAYERTKPLRGGSVVASTGDAFDSATGTTYITAGGGGAAAYTVFREDGRARVATADGGHSEAAPWTLPHRTGQHATLCVDVTPPGSSEPATMRLRAISVDGVTLDDTMLRRGSGRANGPDGTPWLVGAGVVALAGGATALTLASRRHEHSAEPD